MRETLRDEGLRQYNAAHAVAVLTKVLHYTLLGELFVSDTWHMYVSTNVST